MARITFILIYFLSLARVNAFATNDSNSCLYLYFNISNCLNCNAYINPLINNDQIKSNYKLFYLIDEEYKPKGSQILSEYLRIDITEENVIYNDSLIENIITNTSSGSGIIFLHDDYEVIFDITSISSLHKYIKSNLTSLVNIDSFLKNEVLSHQLLLKIIEKDTFVIDQTLGIIYKNGIKLSPKLFLWDIPGLLPESHKVTDSTSVIYRVEIDNISKIDSTYLIFCSGNQLFENLQDKNNIELYPRSLILLIKGNEFNSLSNFSVTMLSDEKGCYFDDYSIYEMWDQCYITSECGKGNLKPRLSLLDIDNEKVIVKSSKSIRLNKELRNCIGYTADLGKDIIYFIGITKIFGFEQGSLALIEYVDFTESISNKDYIAGTTNFALPDYKILINSKLTYNLLNNFNPISTNEITEYKIKFIKEKIGNIISNCIYDAESNEFSFINKLGYYVSLKIL
jgi:hypothetical protein